VGYAHKMKSVRHIARLVAATVLITGTGSIAVIGGSSPVRAAACSALCGGGEFHPLTPARIFDSRPATAINDAAPGPKLLAAPAPATFDIDLLGQGSIPADPLDVLAVVVNITVTDPGASGYLEAYGKGFRPDVRTSIVNFTPNQTVPNVAIVRPGVDGDLTIGLFGQSSTANVVVDVFGWFSTSNDTATASTGGARLIPTTPSRVLDTRDGTGVASVGPLGQKATIDLQILGVNGVNPPVTAVVPLTGVTGVLLNVVGITTEPGATSTYLSVVPDPLAAGQDPTTSNLNLGLNTIKANLVFVPVGKDGKVRIFNNQGLTHVVADVVGYMQVATDPLTRKGRVVPLTSPFRAFDTRVPAPLALGPGQAEDWSFADFAGSVMIDQVAVGKQLGVIGNLTAAEVKRQYPTVFTRSFLTAYPSDAASRPLSSNINSVEGQAVPNMAVLKYSDVNNTVRVYNLAGYAQYVFDASAVVLAD
jgi:hypothetical protein